MYKLVLIRHGQSEWNKENRFTGWTDIALTEQGIEEARNAGKLLKKEGYVFDKAYTSNLSRAIQTLFYMLNEMDQLWVPTEKNWHLNEKHYGALQGLNKSEIAAKYGEEMVLKWRRSYDVEPPMLDETDPRHPKNSPNNAGIQGTDLPQGESLKMTVERVQPFWQEQIVPEMKSGKRIVISAHGNSIRALVKIIDNVPDDKIVGVNIPNAVPLVYEFDEDMNPLRSYYVGDPEEIAKAQAAVIAQGKAK